MKKIIFGLTTLFIASQLLVSCGSESTVLSQFSKRKYLKKYKKERGEDENNINTYYYTASTTNELIPSEVLLEEIPEVDNSEAVIKEEKEIKLNNVLAKNYSTWNSYNRKMDFSNWTYNDFNKNYKNENRRSSSLSDLELILYVILSLILAPLVVILMEGSTARFWWALVFWLAGWSVVATGAGGIFFLVAIVLALISIFSN